MSKIIRILISCFLCVICLFQSDQSSATDNENSANDFSDIMDKLIVCASCHGENGLSLIPANPILAGQEYYYLYVQLKDIKSGLRDSPIMTPMVATMEKDEMKRIAEYYSSQSWPDSDFKANNEDIITGKKAVTAGQCVACHLGSFKGNSRVPALAGQHVEYLKNTMLDFKNKVRLNSPAKGALFASFSDEEIESLAKYLAAYKGQ